MRFARNDDGATSIEYSVIAAAIAAVLAAGYFAAGADLGQLYTNIHGAIDVLHDW